MEKYFQKQAELVATQCHHFSAVGDRAMHGRATQVQGNMGKQSNLPYSCMESVRDVWSI
jgi:hypothetical protein